MSHFKKLLKIYIYKCSNKFIKVFLILIFSMERNNIVKLKCSSINYLDIFGVGFNFLVDGRYKQKTMGGAILFLLYFFIFIGLFFGFGIDLYQRKRPKVSFNTVIKDYNEVSLSNKNFTCSYRVEYNSK